MKMKGIKIVLLLLLFTLPVLQARQFYLSPTGNDSNNGLTPATAWKTPNYAFNTLVAGDTLWVTGGTYVIPASSGTIKSRNAGTQNAPIKVLAIRGEKPVFDCSAFRNWGNESSTFRGMDLRQSWWHVRGIKIYRAGHNGIIVAGENIIVEGCVIEECGHDGIAIGAGSVNALILNCDSYRNAEISGKGENGDGFAAKEGRGTVFRGCRAWENVDDGWDVYGGGHSVLIDSCWAFGNGVNYWPELITGFQGDGNGFKLGGGGGVTGNAPNVVLHSFAFDNVNKGFDQNHNAWGVTCINCTGYNNRGMGNFAFQGAPTEGKHTMINNLSYAGTGQNIAAGSIETTNSWNLGISFRDDMFESLNTAHARLERDDDYRLTDPRITNLFKLKAGNPAIDQGTVQTFIRLKPYYAIPYSGGKPDLGAREFDQGSWVYPEPDEKEPDNGGGNPGERPAGVKQMIVDVPTQFTVTSGGGTSAVWGPFTLSSAESAVFDMQAVGSSIGAVVIQFSKDNSIWEQVGTQAKNGSTSWVNGKVIDISAATAPWGPAIYIRFLNNTSRSVNIRNLKITASIYELLSSLSHLQNDSEIVAMKYYNLQGQEIRTDFRGLVLRKKIHVDNSVKTDKVFLINNER